MSLGLTEIALILIVVLILFGGKRIPELAKALCDTDHDSDEERGNKGRVRNPPEAGCRENHSGQEPKKRNCEAEGRQEEIRCHSISFQSICLPFSGSQLLRNAQGPQDSKKENHKSTEELQGRS